MEGLFGLLFGALIIASIWGGIVLALRWMQHWLARTILALMLATVFIIASAVAVISGCTAVNGPVNFH